MSGNPSCGWLPLNDIQNVKPIPFLSTKKRHWDCQVALISSNSAAPVPGEVQSWVGAVLSLAYLPLIGLSQTFSACLYFSLPPTITSLLCLSLAMPTLINPFKNE